MAAASASAGRPGDPRLWTYSGRLSRRQGLDGTSAWRRSSGGTRLPHGLEDTPQLDAPPGNRWHGTAITINHAGLIRSLHPPDETRVHVLKARTVIR
jgi:hypothetical protein